MECRELLTFSILASQYESSSSDVPGATGWGRPRSPKARGTDGDLGEGSASAKKYQTLHFRTLNRFSELSILRRKHFISPKFTLNDSR